MADNEAALGWNDVCDKRSYYRLFAGHILALLATGITTVVLAVLAFDLAGAESGAVIGTALSIKMLAYVIAAPVLTVLTDRLPRKQFLIALDLIRAGSLILLLFVTAAWQIYVLVFFFAVASATFGFVYLALVPYLLGSEEDYTHSLARSRIASELEGPVSPLIAAGLMLALGVSGIFILAAGAFVVSALLVKAARLPRQIGAREGGIWQKLTRGPRLFVQVAEFRAVIALDVAVALATAMVMVNTAVIVQGLFHLDLDAFAFAFFAFGLGSIVGAMLLPLALSLTDERRLMMTGAVILTLGLMLGVFQDTMTGLLLLWALLGLGVVWALTPVTYLIRRIAAPADLQTLFAAQMAIANGCLLVAYPLAGWLGATLGMSVTFAVLGMLAGLATLVAHHLWIG
ncbi:MAG: MFS transporter [Rhodobacterales bacterium]|nr:MFS transporter [Rhodobacterales bacterium]